MTFGNTFFDDFWTIFLIDYKKNMYFCNMKRLLTITILMSAIVCVYAQRRAHIYMNQQGGKWYIPVVTDSIVDITVSSDLKNLLFNVTGDMTVPFIIDHIDSLTFEDEPAFESKDRYKVFQVFINTHDGSDVTSRYLY